MSIILNKEELATSKLKADALEILEVGLETVGTENIIKNKIKIENGILKVTGLPSLKFGDKTEASYDLKSFRKIIFVGIGKCALEGAVVLETVLGDFLTKGAVIDLKPANQVAGLRKCKYFEGTHPLPSEQNVEATKEILEMVKDVTEKDLIITLISGGGSALFELPAPGFDLQAIIEKTNELTARGADIYELNAARKEMSQVKGGKFAQICFPAQIISLIFSDVLGNDISVIASGPTVLSESEERVKNILLASNADALRAMKKKAEELGFKAAIETDKFSGNAKEVGKKFVQREPKPSSCFLFGGETTVNIPNNHGEGGRNQTVALSALPFIQPDSVLICAASDGWDNTPYAGAIIDNELFDKSKLMNLSSEEFLERSDSYNFFKQVGGAISTGKLGSNVSDLCILIYK
jgi:glycerate-2-kinase